MKLKATVSFYVSVEIPQDTPVHNVVNEARRMAMMYLHDRAKVGELSMLDTHVMFTFEDL